MRRISQLYTNISIKGKLMLGFMVVILLTLVLGLIAVTNVNKIDNSYSQLLNNASARATLMNNSESNILDIRRASNYSVMAVKVMEDVQQFNEQQESINKNIETLRKNLANYIESVNKDPVVWDNVREESTNRVNTILNSLNELVSAEDELKTALLSDTENAAVLNEKINLVTDISADINTELTELLAIETKTVSDVSTNNSKSTNSTIVFTLGLILVTVIISVLLAFITSGSIVGPIKKLGAAIDKLAQGNLDLKLRTNRKDEIGKLSNNIDIVINVIGKLISNIHELGNEMEDGLIDSIIDVSQYQGEFKQAANEINIVVISLVNDLNTISRGIQAYSNGDFEYTCARMKGQKAVFHESLDKLKENLTMINTEINTTVNDAKAGKLDTKINSDIFEGDWKKLAQNVSEFIETVKMPIHDVSNALEKLAQGDFEADIVNQYEGEFDRMVTNINTLVYTLSNVIGEISFVLQSMANQDLDVYVEDDYMGDLSKISKALKLIINNFNTLIGEVSSSVEQITVGSKQIAESSTSLATGATQQASAVEQLNATIKNVSEQIKENTQSVERVDSLAQTAKQNADNGNQEMNEMLEAMEEINKASSNISSIIKVIDDIAFQTNILALNAAVEAARAGEHGKGFSVVAEEVRNLAGKSQKSANETTVLIETSLSKVSQGIQIANSTAETLRDISSQINEISDIASDVAKASNAQENSIKQITEGIGQISEVVVTNSSTSQESAAASEELASQSEVFRDMVSGFKLKKV